MVDELAPDLSKLKHRILSDDPRESGFTLIELLVVVAILGLLGSLLFPALAKARAKTTAAACLNNLKQLQICWQMYVDDHEGRVPPNRAVLANGVWRSTPDSWIGGSSATHDSDTRGIEEGLLFRYDYNRSVALYRCPADRSLTVSGSRRTRSYSMHGVLGGRTNEAQTVIVRQDQVAEPGKLFVLIDEHEDSIDDAHFLVWPYPDDRWVNLPAGRHSQVGVLSFADGHVEVWRWMAAKAFRPRVGYWKPAEGAGDLEDLRRLQSCTLFRPSSAVRD